jgi:bacterioferritin-associated ferredoxin
MEAGACSAKEVRAACGMRPGCGSCVNRICALLKESAPEPVLRGAVEAAA